jgi:hypothetical protein
MGRIKLLEDGPVEFVPNRFYRMVRRERGISDAYRQWRKRYKRGAKRAKFGKKGEEVVIVKKQRRSASGMPFGIGESVDSRAKARVISVLRSGPAAEPKVVLHSTSDPYLLAKIRDIEDLNRGPRRAFNVEPIVPSASAIAIFRPTREYRKEKEVYRTGTVEIPERTDSKYFAVVIPSGEGKTWVTAHERMLPGCYFDVDDIGRLEKRKESRKRGAAEFVVEVPDFTGFEDKILLVRNLDQVPFGFDVLGAFALCDCALAHPHMDELMIERKGAVRMNRQDRELLPRRTLCCSDFGQRNKELRKIVSKIGIAERLAKKAAARRREKEEAEIRAAQPQPSVPGFLGKVLSLLR